MACRQACGVPADAPTVLCDGVNLAVSREGSGPAVVCLHAIGHGGGDYAAFAAALKQRVEVIRVDWPGQGRSGDDHQPPSAQRYAELLVSLLDQLNVVNPVLVGNSIGAAAALIYASRRPVRALVLCDAGGLVPVNGMVRTASFLFSRFFSAGERGAGWFARAYAFYYRYVVLPAPAAAQQRQRIIAAGPECARLLRMAWQGFARPQADLRKLAAQLQVPVWCVWGRADRVIPLWLCRPAIARMPQASLSTFAGGHSAFIEQPDWFAAEFNRFLDRL